MLLMSDKVKWTVTAAIDEKMRNSVDFKSEVLQAIGLFSIDYWESLPEEERRNDSELLKESSSRFVNSYETNEGTVTISLDCREFNGRVMFGEEYEEYLKSYRRKENA